MTDLVHLSHQLAEVTCLFACLCLLFVLLRFVVEDHCLPYLRAEIFVANAKDHARSEAFGFFVPLLERPGRERILDQRILGHVLPSAFVLALGVLGQLQKIICSLIGVVHLDK